LQAQAVANPNGDTGGTCPQPNPCSVEPSGLFDRDRSKIRLLSFLFHPKGLKLNYFNVKCHVWIRYHHYTFTTAIVQAQKGSKIFTRYARVTVQPQLSIDRDPTVLTPSLQYAPPKTILWIRLCAWGSINM